MGGFDWISANIVARERVKVTRNLRTTSNKMVFTVGLLCKTDNTVHVRFTSEKLVELPRFQCLDISQEFEQRCLG